MNIETTCGNTGLYGMSLNESNINSKRVERDTGFEPVTTCLEIVL